MNSDEAVVHIVQTLNDRQIPYMVTGSMATNLFGIPRSTLDADFVLDVQAQDVFDMLRRLPPQFRVEPQMSFESVTATTRHIISLVGSKFKIELFHLSDDEHDRQRFKRRRRGMLFNQPVWLPTPEDIIITKLNWSKSGRRSKDIDDARNVIAVQGNKLDWAYLESWCDRHGTRSLLDSVRAGLP